MPTGPKPAAPRLNTLTSMEVVNEIVETFAATRRRLHPIELKATTDSLQVLGVRVIAVTQFAQGNRIDALARDYTERHLAALLYGSLLGTIGASVAPEEVVAGREPTRAVDVVLLAAQARRDMDDGQNVTVRGLACLASVGPSKVTTALKTGVFGTKCERNDGRAGPPITAAAARRWLAQRERHGA